MQAYPVAKDLFESWPSTDPRVVCGVQISSGEYLVPPMVSNSSGLKPSKGNFAAHVKQSTHSNCVWIEDEHKSVWLVVGTRSIEPGAILYLPLAEEEYVAASSEEESD